MLYITLKIIQRQYCTCLSLEYFECDLLEKEEKEHNIKDAKLKMNLTARYWDNIVTVNYFGHILWWKSDGKFECFLPVTSQTLLESMVGAAESLCPHVMKKSNLRQDLIKDGMTKMVIPRSFVKNTLLEQSGIDIMNKIRSVHLPVKENCYIPPDSHREILWNIYKTEYLYTVYI